MVIAARIFEFSTIFKTNNGTAHLAQNTNNTMIMVNNIVYADY